MIRAFWRQNIQEYFTGSAPPTSYSWSYFSVGCSTPFYSWSASLIRSAYLFLYISFCFRFHKTLTNLTSLRQHHLQYNTIGSIDTCPRWSFSRTEIETSDVETQFFMPRMFKCVVTKSQTLAIITGKGLLEASLSDPKWDLDLDKMTPRVEKILRNGKIVLKTVLVCWDWVSAPDWSLAQGDPWLGLSLRLLILRLSFWTCQGCLSESRLSLRPRPF